KGELEHRRLKRFYLRTNKNSGFEEQVTRQQRRERMLYNIHRRVEETTMAATDSMSSSLRRRTGSTIPFHDSEPLPYTDPEAHHHIAKGQHYHENIYRWLHENEDDPALKNFLPDLQGHLLSRLLGKPFTGDEEEYTEDELDSVEFVDDRIYKHKVLRINYTTYDLR
ncbi:hypothetical protein CPC08DRAFT_620758, partial [Agrocybe pediades]